MNTFRVVGVAKKHFLPKQNLALLRNLSDMGSTFKQFVGVMNLACYSLK